MEEQVITVTIRSRGDKCELSDAELKEWYAAKIAALFDPRWGTPEIAVNVERTECR